MSLLGAKLYTIQRPNPKTKVYGKWVDNGFSDLAIEMTVYPADKQTYERLAINNINRGLYICISEVIVEINDEFDHKGERMKVIDIEEWDDDGFLEHYVAFASILEK